MSSPVGNKPCDPYSISSVYTTTKPQELSWRQWLKYKVDGSEAPICQKKCKTKIEMLNLGDHDKMRTQFENCFTKCLTFDRIRPTGN